MKFFNNIGNVVKRTAAISKQRIVKRSPELCMIVGGVTFVATVVVACRQTLKCEEILDAHQRKMDDIENCLELAAEEGSGVTYDEQTAKKDRFVAYCQTGLGFARVYAPAILLGAVSVTAFGSGFHIIKKRNLALSAAYTAVDTAFKEYRGRVRDELGDETDKYFRYGYKKVQNAVISGKNENGEDISITKDEIDTVPFEEGDGLCSSATFVFAPETSKYYFPDEVHNDAALSAARSTAQIDFESKGYLFLNDVLKSLGLKEVPYGQLIGWIKGQGDQYIDFRTKKVYRKASTNPNRNPLGVEYECIYEFDFNTCGTIWDRI